MSRICLVYASYLIRYGTSMRHVREVQGATVCLDMAVYLISKVLPVKWHQRYGAKADE
jgi:hypothetical protein